MYFFILYNTYTLMLVNLAMNSQILIQVFGICPFLAKAMSDFLLLGILFSGLNLPLNFKVLQVDIRAPVLVN